MISLQQLAHLIHGYPNPSRNFQSEYRCFTPSSSCWHKLVIGNVSIITWLQPVYLIREHPKYNSFTPVTTICRHKKWEIQRKLLVPMKTHFLVQTSCWCQASSSGSTDPCRRQLVDLLHMAFSYCWYFIWNAEKTDKKRTYTWPEIQHKDQISGKHHCVEALAKTSWKCISM